MTTSNLLINSNLHIISGLPPVMKLISFSYIFVTEQRMSENANNFELVPSYKINFGAFIKSAYSWVLSYPANYKEIIVR